MTSKLRKTPWVAGLTAFALSVVILPLGKVETLASLASLTTMFAFISVNVALIALRFREPTRERAFRVPLSIGKIPIPPLLVAAACVIFLFQFDRWVYMFGSIAIAGSAFFYFLNSKFEGKKTA